MDRVGDTYGGNQFVDVSVRAYIYRWRPAQKGLCGVPDASFCLNQGLLCMHSRHAFGKLQSTFAHPLIELSTALREAVKDLDSRTLLQDNKASCSMPRLLILGLQVQACWSSSSLWAMFRVCLLCSCRSVHPASKSGRMIFDPWHCFCSIFNACGNLCRSCGNTSCRLWGKMHA